MDLNKPRVAVYYHILPSTGYRNDGAPGFCNYNLRKLLNGKPDLESIDGNVLHLWPNKDAESFGKFDLHLWVDYGEDALNLPCDWYPPSPNAYWVSDAHLGFDYRLKTAKKFDHVFLAQKEFISQFIAGGIPPERVHYLPHAFEPDVYKPTEILNKWDWIFLGHLNSPHRIDLLDRMCKEFPNWEIGWRMNHVPGWNCLDHAAWKYSQAKVGVNFSIKKDLNMRVFEMMGSRLCLLTDDVPDIREHFEDYRHLVLFNSVEDAVDKMRRLLGNSELREFISMNGYKEVLAKHTYMDRVKEILKVCLNYVQEDKGVLQLAH